MKWTCPVCGHGYDLIDEDDGIYYSNGHYLNGLKAPCYKCQDIIDEEVELARKRTIAELKRLGD